MKDTPILVFDEATSSLDSITEKSIMRALKLATKGRTSIIIAHRLSTVVHCDKILVIRDGAVAEEGTHSQLLETPGSYYSKLWQSQNTTETTTTTESCTRDDSTNTMSQTEHHHHDDHAGCGHAHH